MTSWMRACILGALLLVGAALLPAASSGAPRHGASRQQDASNSPTWAQLPYRIRDSFNGTSVNPAVWYTDPGQNSGTTVGVQGGSLQLSASATASSGFHDGISTHCQAVGDFDARIRFTLSTWPANDNVSLAVNSIPGNTFVENQVGGDVYGLFVKPSPTPTGFSYITVPTSIRSGLLWLSRRGDLISAYVRSAKGSWSQIAKFTGSTSPTFIDVAIWNVSGFGGQPATAAVQSFKLDAAGLSC